MKSFLLHLTDDDTPYLPALKHVIGGAAKVFLSNCKPVTITEMVMIAREKKVTQVATTSPLLLKLLVKKVSSRNDYSGSIIEYGGIEFLILNPLEHLVKVNSARFLFKRYLDKFIREEEWMQFPPFAWKLFHPKDTDQLIDDCVRADFISIDIETGNEQDRIINCIGFTAVSLDRAAHTVSQTTTVIPFYYESTDGQETGSYERAVIKAICSLPVAKVFQNGKYDIAYLLRFGIPVTNYAFDTINFFHCWYSELPKRLDFITSFLIRKWIFWKDEITTSNKMDYYAYNAKDSYITAMCFLSILKEAPAYTFNNYMLEFPLVFPCLLTELTGLRRDNIAMEEEEVRFTASLLTQLQSIRKMVGNPHFNPASPKQTLKLIQALGSGDITSSGKIPMDKVKFRHPLNKRLLDAIQKYREDFKLRGTYLRDKDPKDGTTKSWNERIFYSLNPHGTDTGRLASKESVFWCGWQIHNIPRDREDIQVRRGIIADPGFYIGECDRSQAEARDTAYLSGDKRLISVVEDKSKDFHGYNAAAFFGIPYNEIITSKLDEATGNWLHTTINKPIRQISKNTNHGANYNIGAAKLVDTMGIGNVLKARALLKLPSNWSPQQVCQYLLDGYTKTYPGIKGAWYDSIKSAVTSTQLLVGPTGWIRYCFGAPATNKRDLNAYVAHPPQSLNAMELNKAYMRVFYEIALVEPHNFKLGPQIHDSILFQYRIGYIHLAYAVQECMNNPIEITDVYGIKRLLTVPTDLKGESTVWSELKPLHLRSTNNKKQEQTEDHNLLLTTSLQIS